MNSIQSDTRERVAPTRGPKAWAVILFYGIVTLWLGIYLTLAHRYNGQDYQVYVQALQSLSATGSPYDYKNATSFHYSPVGLFPFLLLAPFPLWAQHFLIFLLSYAALARMTVLTLRALSSRQSLATLPLALLVAPWLLVNQGIGFQFESGNINLLLLYVLVEGFYQWYLGRRSWGFWLLALPALFKPAFGIACYFVFFKRLRQNLLPAAKAGAGVLLVAMLPLLYWGYSEGVQLYRDWWFSNAAHTHAILSGEIVGANLSLLSFAYDRLHLSLDQTLLFVFFPALVGFHFLVHRANDAASFSLGMLFLFLFSPATFPYSILGLLFPATHALALCLEKRQPLYWLLFAVFSLGLLLINVNFLGREVYNSVAVPYRLQGFSALPLVGLFFMAFRKRS